MEADKSTSEVPSDTTTLSNAHAEQAPSDVEQHQQQHEGEQHANNEHDQNQNTSEDEVATSGDELSAIVAAAAMPDNELETINEDEIVVGGRVATTSDPSDSEGEQHKDDSSINSSQLRDQRDDNESPLHLGYSNSDRLGYDVESAQGDLSDKTVELLYNELKVAQLEISLLKEQVGELNAKFDQIVRSQAARQAERKRRREIKDNLRRTRLERSSEEQEDHANIERYEF